MTRYQVLYADTDLAGVVYHANYLRYFEAARTEVLREAGVEVSRLHLEQGIVFAISECSLQYHRPARYGDVLCIAVHPTRLGPARLTLAYEVRRESDLALLVTGETTIAALDATTGKVVRLPEPMRQAMAGQLQHRQGA